MEVNNIPLYIRLSVFAFLAIISCNNAEKISDLLTSSRKNEIISGAYMAGESKNLKFVPMLLENSYDVRTSTQIRFKGISVYQAKMIALSKIFDVEPPVKITSKPDSSIINFYQGLHRSHSMQR